MWSHALSHYWAGRAEKVQFSLRYGCGSDFHS